MAAKRIFLLEDDAGLHETVREYLEDHGYEVISAYEGLEAEEILYEQYFDLLLLDINLPGLNGYELLRELRERGVGTPAIFLTARGSVEDLEEGFLSGCDDYLRKPFALKELLLRVETLLKRPFYHGEGERIAIGEGIEYDPRSGSLYLGEREHRLGGKESRLLELFLKHPDEILAHEQIYDALWDYDEEPSDSSLRTYIKNLRKLIGKERILSIKKQGYRYLAQK
ncbi:response regulator transcription factor [Nitratifractor sp.]